jgi:hypothetical protein
MRWPEVERYRLRLRLTGEARFHFEHGGVLRGLLSRALGRHDLPPELIPFAPESGRVRFAPGDAYQIGLTLVGPARGLAGELFDGLARLGRSPAAGRPAPVLGGNFDLEAAEPLPPPDFEAEARRSPAARS